MGNTARALTALGVPVETYAVCGSDPLGDLLVHLFARDSVRSHLRRSRDAATSYSIVVEPAGQDRAFWHHSGANGEFTADDLRAVTQDVVHFGYPSLLTGLMRRTGEEMVDALRTLKQRGATVSCDLAVVDARSASADLDWLAALRRAAPHIDVLSPSIDDLRSITGVDHRPARELAAEFSQTLVDWGVAVVAISCGAEGQVLRTGSRDRMSDGGPLLRELGDAWGDRRLSRTASRVERVVSANGAGDAATAGLLRALLDQNTPEEALSVAEDSAIAVLTGKRSTTEMTVTRESGLERRARA